MADKTYFLSFQKSDLPMAKAVSAKLKPAKARYLSTDLRPGENWKERVETALRDSDEMVMLVGPRAVTNPWLGYELGLALGHEKPVHVVLLPGAERSEMPGWMQTQPMLDASGADGPKAVAELLAAEVERAP